jgi:hypothetical protein
MRLLNPVHGSVQAHAALDVLADRAPRIGQTPRVQRRHIQPTRPHGVVRGIGRDEAKACQARALWNSSPL